MSLNLVVKCDPCECHIKSKLVLLLTLSDCLFRFKEENQPMNCGSASHASNVELQGGRVFVHPPEQKVTQEEGSYQHPVILMLGLHRQHLPQGHESQIQNALLNMNPNSSQPGTIVFCSVWKHLMWYWNTVKPPKERLPQIQIIAFLYLWNLKTFKNRRKLDSGEQRLLLLLPSQQA